MIIQAELKCKQTGCEAEPCAVDKVIELPSPRFRQFSRALLADYDFIAENKDAIQRDKDARHCLLILDAEEVEAMLGIDDSVWAAALCVPQETVKKVSKENTRQKSFFMTVILLNDS